MTPILAEVRRGEILECVHRGSVAVATPDGAIVDALGEPDRTILPRSAAKPLQALPLVESGAADAAGLDETALALACASHGGAPVHVSTAARWLASIGAGEADLRCGAHPPYDEEARLALERAGERPSQLHNNCSGKHCGFVTLAGHLGAGPVYEEIDHPVQEAVAEAMAETCGEAPSGHAVDGCSAPNFAVTLAGLARAMARFAAPGRAFAGARAAAAERLADAMAARPLLVAGEGRAATALIRAARGRAVVKSGAEGVFVAILRERRLGIALKIDDGAGRAAQAAIAALLARHGAVAPDDPAVAGLIDRPVLNARSIPHGRVRASAALLPG
jgi:L-asparaginase II